MERGIPADCQLKNGSVFGNLRCEPRVLPFIRHGKDIINVHVLPFLFVSYAHLERR